MKKEARFAIAKRLEDDQRSIRSKLHYNRGAMKNLVQEQTRLKRELVVLEELIRHLRPNAKVSGAGTASAGLPGWASLNR
jgi:hypothetical protein